LNAFKLLIRHYFWLFCTDIYNLSQKKTKLLSHTITLTHINWFWWFLAEM